LNKNIIIILGVLIVVYILISLFSDFLTIPTGSVIFGVPRFNNPGFEDNNFQFDVHFASWISDDDYEFDGSIGQWAINTLDFNEDIKWGTQYGVLGKGIMIEDTYPDRARSITQVVEIYSGYKYTCSAYAKNVYNSSRSDGYWEDGYQDLYLFFFDSNYKLINISSEIEGPPDNKDCDDVDFCTTAKSKTWTKISVTRKAPSNAKYLSCFANSMIDDLGATYWDNFELEMEDSEGGCADLTDNGIVNQDDLTEIKNIKGTKSDNSSFNIFADFDDDGEITDIDIACLRSFWEDTTLNCPQDSDFCGCVSGCADFDGDNDVDADDKVKFTNLSRICSGNSKYEEDADFDSDGCVRNYDYEVDYACFMTHYGKTVDCIEHVGPCGGIGEGNCSSVKPKYCLNGTLVNNCTKCGCNSGYTCLSNGTCTSSCVEDWNCGNWTSCINNTRTKVCVDLHSCGTTSIKPAEQESCQTPGNTPGVGTGGGTCYDGIRNQNEEDVDCGGSCNPCRTGISANLSKLLWIIIPIIGVVVVVLILLFFVQGKEKPYQAIVKSNTYKDVEKYIVDSIRSGVSTNEIETNLINAGWPIHKIRSLILKHKKNNLLFRK